MTDNNSHIVLHCRFIFTVYEIILEDTFYFINTVCRVHKFKIINFFPRNTDKIMEKKKNCFSSKIPNAPRG